MQKAHYSPPWAEVGIVGIAGSSGSGKTSLAKAIVKELSLPWVVIMSMDSFYKVLTPEQSEKAFRNEYDFDSPKAVDFDLLVRRLQELKEGKKADIPIYSFERHARLPQHNVIYSPHVLILEGIFALHDKRVRDLLDLRIFAEADADVCLSRRFRDVRERGRDIEGCIKQWFSFVKPNFQRYVEPQREVADIIVPRGIENDVAIGMITDHVRKTLTAKSAAHQRSLRLLTDKHAAEDGPLSSNIHTLPLTPQISGLNTIILDPCTTRGDLIFHFDRLANILIEHAASLTDFAPHSVTTPQGYKYTGLRAVDQHQTSAVVLLRGGTTLESALRRVYPDCGTGRLLIQTSLHTGEPELHYTALAPDISTHSRVLLLDPQMSSGGAALMAVRVLCDHGVPEDRIIFVTYFAGNKGLSRLMAVYPDIRVVVARIGEDMEQRWLEEKYLGC